MCLYCPDKLAYSTNAIASECPRGGFPLMTSPLMCSDLTPYNLARLWRPFHKIPDAALSRLTVMKSATVKRYIGVRRCDFCHTRPIKRFVAVQHYRTGPAVLIACIMDCICVTYTPDALRDMVRTLQPEICLVVGTYF